MGGIQIWYTTVYLRTLFSRLRSKRHDAPVYLQPGDSVSVGPTKVVKR